MKATKRFFISIVSFLLVLSLTFAIALTAASANTQPSTKEEIVELFNETVNTIKTQRPLFYRTEVSGIPATDNGKAESILDIISGISGVFEDLTGEPEFIESLLGGLFVKSSTEESRFLIKKGQDNKDLVSVKGQQWVSNLTADDVDTFTYNPNPDGSFVIILNIADVINPDENSSIAQVIDLGDVDDIQARFASFLPDLELDTFAIKYTDIKAECKVDLNGELMEYSTHYKASLALAEDIGFDLDIIEFSPEFYLNEVQYSEFDWEPRINGDLDGDGKVAAADARIALRVAAGLDTISEKDKRYADIDNDGKVSAADARSILRAAANLDVLPKLPALDVEEPTTEEPTTEEPTTEEPTTEEPTTEEPPIE